MSPKFRAQIRTSAQLPEQTGAKSLVAIRFRKQAIAFSKHNAENANRSKNVRRHHCEEERGENGRLFEILEQNGRPQNGRPLRVYAILPTPGSRARPYDNKKPREFDAFSSQQTSGVCTIKASPSHDLRTWPVPSNSPFLHSLVSRPSWLPRCQTRTLCKPPAASTRAAESLNNRLLLSLQSAETVETTG